MVLGRVPVAGGRAGAAVKVKEGMSALEVIDASAAGETAELTCVIIERGVMVVSG